jgi:hypothetical protein
MTTAARVGTVIVIACVGVAGGIARAQQPAMRETPRPGAQVVPRLVPYSGRLITPDGTPLTGVVAVTFVFHRSEDDVAALWRETQRLELNADGPSTHRRRLAC